jgi:hypothetical protein
MQALMEYSRGSRGNSSAVALQSGNARRHLPGLPAPPCRLRDAGSHRRNMLGWQTRMVEPRGKIEGMKRAEKKST